MRKKQILSRILYSTGITGGLRKLRTRFIREIPILCYHRILDVAANDEFPFDGGLIDASIDNFQWQMEYIKNHYHPISFKSLLNFISGQGELPRRPIIITFDDGYDDNYINAFPILKKLNMPATIFLATGYIGKNKTFWYDWLAYIILNLESRQLEIPSLGFRQSMPGSYQERYDLYNRCVALMKKVSNTRRLQVLSEISELYGKCYSQASNEVKNLSKPLTWDQCREMSAHGIEFGSHSVTHPILASLDDDRLLLEISQSKQMIEDNIGFPVRALAIHNGQESDFNDKILNMITENGYIFCISLIAGTNPLPLKSSDILKRMKIEPRNDKSIFLLSLAFPNM